MTAICAIVANMQPRVLARGRVGNGGGSRLARGHHAGHACPRADRTVRQATDRIVHVRTRRPHSARGGGRRWTSAHPLVRAYADWHAEHVRTIVACERLTVSCACTLRGNGRYRGDPGRRRTAVRHRHQDLEQRRGFVGLADRRVPARARRGGDQCSRADHPQLPSREPGVLHHHDLENHDQDQRAFINAPKLYRWKEGSKPIEAKGIRFGAKVRPASTSSTARRAGSERPLYTERRTAPPSSGASSTCCSPDAERSSTPPTATAVLDGQRAQRRRHGPQP